MQRLFALGSLSTWAESILQAHERTSGFDITRCPDLNALKSELGGSGEMPVVVLENAFGSPKTIASFRQSGLRGLLVWFGKSFSKEDYITAMEERVYQVVDSPSTSDTRFSEALSKAQQAIVFENENHQLLRTLKTVVLQSPEEGFGADVLDELKTVVAKLDRSHQANEWVGKNQSSSSDNRLPLHQSATLSDAMLTIADLERTGVLRVQSEPAAQEGLIQFIQGKVVGATSEIVHGAKAIFRMFLWPDVQFQFSRLHPNEINVDEPIEVSVRDICVRGEKLSREFEQIRTQVPPSHIQLEMDASAVNASSRLESELFSTLSSIVEFGKVSQVLDYNSLPDVSLYKALIALRRKRFIRVVSN